MFYFKIPIMKKNVWLLGVAVAALSSCSQSEVLDVPESKQIRFEEFVERNSRATIADDAYDLKTSKITNYWVYGAYTTDVTTSGDGTAESPYVYEGDFDTTSPVFEGMKMSRTNAEADWTYGATDRWVTNAMYRFAAYSNGNEELANVSYNATDDELTISNYSVIDINEVSNSNKPLDLVASIAGDRHSSTGDQPIQFQFRHLLSKVTFHLTNASNSADVLFTNIQVNNIAKVGDCVCVYPSTAQQVFPKNITWTRDAAPAGGYPPFNYGNITVPFNATATTSDEITFYIIPQSNADATVTLTVTEKIKAGTGDIDEDEDGYKDGAYNVENLTFSLATNTHYSSSPTDFVANKWEPGYHYRYLITKGTEFKDIQFQAIVTDWNRDRDGNGNVENNDNVTPSPVTEQ